VKTPEVAIPEPCWSEKYIKHKTLKLSIKIIFVNLHWYSNPLKMLAIHSTIYRFIKTF